MTPSDGDTTLFSSSPPVLDGGLTASSLTSCMSSEDPASRDFKSFSTSFFSLASGFVSFSIGCLASGAGLSFVVFDFLIGGGPLRSGGAFFSPLGGAFVLSLELPVVRLSFDTLS